jgi:iron-sulfur cluster assembly protein
MKCPLCLAAVPVLLFAALAASGAELAAEPLKAEAKAVVTLTPRAAEVKSIAKGLGIKTYWLRVGVKADPDAGSFRYLLDITEDAPDPEKDQQATSHAVRIVVDHKSSIYLDGTTIDFRDDERGKGFVFKNPNAKE